MKKEWTNPMIEDLDVDQTANSNQPDTANDGVKVGINIMPDGELNICTVCS